MLVESARGVSTEFVGWSSLAWVRRWRPPMEISHRIAQVLGVPTAHLCCEDDDLAEVILAWSTLTRGGRAQAKKAVLRLVAGRQR